MPCILYNTGSYCPMHFGHIKLFDESKKFLETNTNFKVVACFFSLSNDLYVNNKAYKNYF